MVDREDILKLRNSILMLLHPDSEAGLTKDQRERKDVLIKRGWSHKPDEIVKKIEEIVNKVDTAIEVKKKGKKTNTTSNYVNTKDRNFGEDNKQGNKEKGVEKSKIIENYKTTYYKIYKDILSADQLEELVSMNISELREYVSELESKVKPIENYKTTYYKIYKNILSTNQLEELVSMSSSELREYVSELKLKALHKSV